MTVDGVRPDDAAEVVNARGIRGHGAGKTDFHKIKGRLGLSKCAAQSNAHHQKTSNLTVHGRPLEGCCRRPAALRGTFRIDAVTWFRGIWVKQTKSSKQKGRACGRISQFESNALPANSCPFPAAV